MVKLKSAPIVKSALGALSATDHAKHFSPNAITMLRLDRLRQLWICNTPSRAGLAGYLVRAFMIFFPPVSAVLGVRGSLLIS